MGCKVLYILAMVAVGCSGTSIDQRIKKAGAGRTADSEDLVELDMKFTPEQKAAMEAAEAGTSRNAYHHEQYRWPDAVVPYVIQNDFSNADLSAINAAIEDIQATTCITFRTRSTESDYISIQDGGGCSSYVGRIGGMQPVSLGYGCRYKGTVIHELMHALGFFHEQSRPDRDDHISIQWQNIDSSMSYNFDKNSDNVVNTFDVDYDYTSVMHYGQYSFSSNGQRTIVTLDPAYQEVIGNRNEISFRDVKRLNIAYSCDSHCTHITCSGEGFVDKDCQCMCPGNPSVACSGGGGETGGGDSTETGGGDSTETGGGSSTTCTNEDDNCESWANQGYCTGEYEDYMSTNCRQACDLCDDGGNGGSSTCEDLNDNCNSWASDGYCTGEYEEYMSDNCKKSCSLCGGACEDLNDSCATWASAGYCRGEYESYMSVNCKNSCNNCAACTDEYTSCSYWASVGACAELGSYCQKSCGNC